MTSWTTRVANALGLRADPPATVEPPAPVDVARADRVLWTSPQRSARIGAVFTCASIIATAVEQLSVDVDRNGVQIDSAPFIRRPDPSLPRTSWLHQTTLSLALHGNAYLRVWRDVYGHATVARVLPPGHVFPYTDPKTGRPRYTVMDERDDLTRNEITHLRFMHLPGEQLGLGPIQAAQAELGAHVDLVDASTSWIRESGSPSGILTTEQQLTKEDRKALLYSWRSVPAGRTRLLSHGLEYKSYAINPKDAQFLESRRFSKTEIVDMFGIPASLVLGVDKGGSDTYANVSQDWLGFVRFRLMRYVRELEEALTDLLPRGQRARFNLESLLRSDALTRMQIHAAAIDAKIYSPEHARDIEGIDHSAAPKEETA